MRKRIQQVSKVTTSFGQGELVNERWGVETLYEGLQVKRSQSYVTKQQFNAKGTKVRNGKIVAYLGDTQDVINDDLTAQVRLISSVSGRDKPTNNKKAMGEDRRKRHESHALSFGVSKGKAFHKQKHSQV